jgi:hypothetical protein
MFSVTTLRLDGVSFTVERMWGLIRLCCDVFKTSGAIVIRNQGSTFPSAIKRKTKVQMMLLLLRGTFSLNRVIVKPSTRTTVGTLKLLKQSWYNGLYVLWMFEYGLLMVDFGRWPLPPVSSVARGGAMGHLHPPDLSSYVVDKIHKNLKFEGLFV